MKFIEIDEPICECKLKVNVDTGLIMEGNTISIDIDKLKELLKDKPPVDSQPALPQPPDFGGNNIIA